MSVNEKSGSVVDFAVIGGSGLYAMDGLADVESMKVETPFGAPSDDVVVGTLGGRKIAFLARHGRGHTIMPTEVNYRANIYALKSLGAKRILAITCCGSLKEEIAPGHIVIPGQFYDRTRRRDYTFFGKGLVAHVSVPDPFCPEMSRVAFEAASGAGGTVHEGGTIVVIEGPRFSTKAESRVFTQCGFDIIGMTVVPEDHLAPEAEICYTALAHVTDYDVWHEKAETASVDAILRQLEANTQLVNEAVRRIVPLEDGLAGECSCPNALADAIITDRNMIDPGARNRLALLVERSL